MPIVKPTARILIVRLSAIGDVLHGLPVLHAIRSALPRSYIGWVVEERAARLLHGQTAIDQLIMLPRGWLTNPRAAFAARRRIRAGRFDVTIDLQGLTKSAVAAWFSGAKIRIGYSGVDGREISPWFNNTRVLPIQTHVIDRGLELLTPLGIVHPPVEFGLVDSPADARTAQDIVGSFELGNRFALINPGAGWPSKLWPVDRFAAVARHLGRQHGLRSIVIWAGQAERAMAEQIAAESGSQARVAPSTSLLELAALARRAAIFVSSDTGPLHIASAVGTPCIALFGPSPGERNGPYGPQHKTLQVMRLEGSSRERRTADGTSMGAITVEHVCQACDQVLAAQLAKRSA